jgi:hypothetical protein
VNPSAANHPQGYLMCGTQMEPFNPLSAPSDEFITLAPGARRGRRRLTTPDEFSAHKAALISKFWALPRRERSHALASGAPCQEIER